mgnify:CR=1 FL=1
MEIRVDSNIREFTQWLDHVQRDQVPYAASRAINDVAVDAQDSVVKNLQSVFKNLKRWWLKQQPTGIKVKFSNKKNLHSRVFTDVYFAQRQKDGGIKKTKSGKNLAVPLPAVPRKYRTSSGAKRMMRERSNVFKTTTKSGHEIIARRKGKKRYPLQVLWILTPTAYVPRRWHIYEVIEKVVKRRFSVHFKKRLDQALATAKPPSR